MNESNEDRLFLISPFDRESITYAEFRNDVESTALSRDELRPLDCYETFRILTATVVAGARLSLLPVEIRPSENLSVPLSYSSRLAVENWVCPMTDSSLDAVRKLGAKIELRSSGTTGVPKAIEHTTETLTRSVRVGNKYRNDVWGFAYHPAHLAGLQVYFQAFCNQNTIVRLFGLEHGLVHEAIESSEITHISSTPTFMKLLCESRSRYRHKKVRRVTVGGEKFGSDLVCRIKEVFPNAKLTNVYALTEAALNLASDGEVFTINSRDRGCLKIIDGQIAIHRSATLDSVAEKNTSEFYMTGDQVEIVNGNPETFRIVGKASDTIIVGGYNVNPLEIESLLLEMPEIKQARVFGAANSITGNIVCCDIVPVEGCLVTGKRIRERLVGKIENYKIPRIVNLVTKIETTLSGKIVRR